MIKAGTKCRVISDSLGNFKTGAIVITLETNCVPFCCLLRDYKPGVLLCDYDVTKYHALDYHELEVLDDRTAQ